MTQAAPIGSSPWNLNHELTWQEAGTWLELIHVAARTLRKRPFLPAVSIPAQSWFQASPKPDSSASPSIVGAILMTF